MLALAVEEKDLCVGGEPEDAQGMMSLIIGQLKLIEVGDVKAVHGIKTKPIRPAWQISICVNATFR